MNKNIAQVQTVDKIKENFKRHMRNPIQSNNTQDYRDTTESDPLK